ncbi:MAG TPA: hypothetical protein VJB99_01130 [Patescibacteria group bacterium]|nr:hypothetical protein [Patescibacteria group bacterium]
MKLKGFFWFFFEKKWVRRLGWGALVGMLILLVWWVGSAALSYDRRQKTELDAKTAILCTNVTNENWYQAEWAGGASSKDTCEYWGGIMLFGVPAGKSFRPCTFGGLPMFCLFHENKDVDLFWITGSRAFGVKTADMERVRPHLAVY